MILGHRRLGERTAHIAPFRQQFVHRLGIDHRAGQNMRPDLGAFFQHADAQIRPAFVCQLLEADRGGQPGRAATYDHHVVWHGFALAHPAIPFLLFNIVRSRM